MLVFIVPLKSPQTSKDWQRACRLVRRTLHSILNQTDQDFRVFLVCNEPPHGLPKHPHLSVVRRDLLRVPANQEDRMADKWLKLHLGVVAARFLAPCHFMLVDADDLVSNRLAAHCAAYPKSFGWYFDRGWVHDEGSRLAFKWRQGFDAVCGTSSIWRAEPADLPVEEKTSAEDCLPLRCSFGHMVIRTNMDALGRPLQSLPFIGSVYVVGTEENWSSHSLRGWRGKKVFLRKLVNYRWVTRGLRREFGLWPLSHYEPHAA